LIIGFKVLRTVRRVWGWGWGKFSFSEDLGNGGFEESSLSSKIWGMGGLKKVLFLRIFGEWEFEESSLSLKVF
jgi:hypothetical protein